MTGEGVTIVKLYGARDITFYVINLMLCKVYGNKVLTTNEAVQVAVAVLEVVKTCCAQMEVVADSNIYCNE